MLLLEKVDKSYVMGRSRLQVLKSIDLTIDKGEMVSIMGASGSGKSTLMNILGLLDGYDAGTYHLDGQLIKDFSETRAAVYRRQWVGFVFQSFNLIPFKTAAENVALPLYYQGVGRSKRLQVARRQLERVGLLDRAEHRPSELSGGQQQRVAIARALVSRPKMLLADEPTGALDSTTSLEIMRLLQEVNGEGVTVVVVTHEREVAAMTRRIIRLRDGRIESANARLPETRAADA
jgi:putative ABC transport system ATP-binding protein